MRARGYLWGDWRSVKSVSNNPTQLIIISLRLEVSYQLAMEWICWCVKQLSNFYQMFTARFNTYFESWHPSTPHWCNHSIYYIWHIVGKFLNLQNVHKFSWHICLYTCILDIHLDQERENRINNKYLPIFIGSCTRETMFENAFLLVNDQVPQPIRNKSWTA